MEERLHEISTTRPYDLHVGVVALVLSAPDNDRKEVFPMWWGDRRPAMVSTAVLLILYVLYLVYATFVHDPQATAFLSHKTDLKRTLHVPVWLNVMRVHILFACMSMLAGAINLSAWIRKRYPRLHRVNGYLYLASVAIVVITSGYMAPYATGGRLSSIGFNLLNILWMLVTIIAIVMIRRDQVDRHRRWMVRSYAFVFTNLSIHSLTWLLHDVFGLAYVSSYSISLYGSILWLWLAAELFIATVLRKTSPNMNGPSIEALPTQTAKKLFL